jgi:DNA-binding CsgD family transcriptional regulator
MDRAPGVIGGLLERGEERALLVGGLTAARADRGGVVVVEGPAGIGKSSVVGLCAAEAERAGMSVLRVRGDDLLSESPFAAVRELFWPVVLASEGGLFDGAARFAAHVFEGDLVAGSDRADASGVLHGLFWLTADLAEPAPLVLLVDDAQWVDAASTRFLIYLARRIEALPVLLVLAVRSGETSRGDELRAELGRLAHAVLRPRPLSEAASAELVRQVLGARADEELCRSCHAATRGNPFYLRELAVALKAEGGRPTAELARRVRALGSGAIAASVLVRLSRLGGECQRLAQALTVLGPGCSLRDAAKLAGLERDLATAAVDALHAAELVCAGSTLTFVHPIVSEAISSQLAPARRASLHAAAARLLLAEGAPADRVAAHLLAANPYGEQWVVEALRGPARGALARGAPEAAVSYLRRALAEPPAAEARLDVLVELGRAEALLPMTHDFTALREALALAQDPRRRAAIAIDLALALFGVLRTADAIAVLDGVLESSAELEPALVERLEDVMIGGGIGDLRTTPRLLTLAERYFERARRGEVQDPRTLATLAQAAAMSGMPADQGSQLARQALADGRLLSRWLDDGYVSAAAALGFTDRFAEGAAALDVGLAEAHRLGSAPMLLQLSTIRSDIAIRSGDLDVAEDYAQRALELANELGAEHLGILFLPIVMLERGDLDGAAELGEAVDVSAPHDSFATQLIAHRGRVRVARGEYEPGLADLLHADHLNAAAGLPLSVVTDWVPAATVALRALGRIEEAWELAHRELEDAVAFKAPRRHGIALATAGKLDPGEAGLTCLRDAVETLERCGARLERARSLAELGIALRQRGELAHAREALFRSLDEAHACGGWALADRARAELVASGARPRRHALRGPESLTSAELRVVRLAADGLTNRQIAQTLFVTAKTVEAHLSHAYAKLGIRSRAQLGPALTRSVDHGAS